MATKTLSVNTATERLTAALTRMAKVGRERNDTTQKLGEVQGVLTNPTADALSRRKAYLDLPDVERQQFGTETEWLLAMRSAELARDDQRAAIAAECRPKIAAAVQAFNVALVAAKTANETIQRLQSDQQTADGLPFEPFGWPEFSLRVEHWRESVRAAGLLVEG